MLTDVTGHWKGGWHNMTVKLCHFTPCPGSQVLCGENEPRESVPSYGTVPSPSLPQSSPLSFRPTWPCDLITFFLIKNFSLTVLWFFCAFNKYTLDIENKIRSDDLVWNKQIHMSSVFGCVCFGNPALAECRSDLIFYRSMCPCTWHTNDPWSVFAEDVCSSTCDTCALSRFI